MIIQIASLKKQIDKKITALFQKAFLSREINSA